MLALLIFFTQAYARSKVEKPNVILIYADDLGRGLLDWGFAATPERMERRGWDYHG